MDVVHPVADDDLRAGVELGHEPGDVAEVVGQIGVGHHDVLALGGREPGQVGAAEAAARLVNHMAPGRLGQAGAVVLGAVVGHDHLAREPALGQRTAGGSDAFLDGVGLVEAGDDDGDARPRIGVGRLS